MSDLMSVIEVLQQVRVALIDPEDRYWSNQDILDGLNGGRRTLYSSKPRVYEVTETVTLVTGHRQTLPNDSTIMFRAIDNVSSHLKRGITPVKLESLTRVRPHWRTEGTTNEIIHVMYEETSPWEYEVYPPALAGTQIRISYAKRPLEITLADLDAGTAVLLSKERQEADGLVDYTISQCLLKESDSTPEAGQRSAMYLQRAIAKFTGESSGRAKSNPNMTAVGGHAPKVNQ
jgi:hypothetical protein